MKNDYNNKESSVVDNGTKSQISHIGSNTVECSLSKSLIKLNNMLHVPNIKRYLISIARLTPYNDFFLLNFILIFYF